MGLAEDLSSAVIQTFKTRWTVRSSGGVPTPEELEMGNDAAWVDAAVLFADLSDSTALVDKHPPEFAAQVYKVYLHCAAKIIRQARGEVTAYDGDRIMGVFVGPSKEGRAVRSALQINHACVEIITPALSSLHPDSRYTLAHTVGVDTSRLFVAREGVRGANDLVWVGRAANYAAKLAALPPDFQTWITSDVYDRISDELRMHRGESIWERRSWTAMRGQIVYGSVWQSRL
jgi:class 3 adenylate cyclase